MSFIDSTLRGRYGARRAGRTDTRAPRLPSAVDRRLDQPAGDPDQHAGRATAGCRATACLDVVHGSARGLPERRLPADRASGRGLCDRVRRRPLMIAADFGRGAALAAVPVLAGFGALRMGDLFVVVFLVGVLTVFFDVSDQSYLPGLIGRDRLVEGNSALEASRTTAYTLGPTLAGY